MAVPRHLAIMKKIIIPPAQQGAQAPTVRLLRPVGRPDTLTAQHVEVAIVLHAMLGDSAASDYLSKHRVACHIIARILHPTGRRRGSYNEYGVRIEAAGQTAPR